MTWERFGKFLGVGAVIMCTVLLGFSQMGGCGSDSDDDDSDGTTLSGRVTNGDGTPIVGATVYLVPTTSVDTWTPIDAADLAQTLYTMVDSTDHDEPLEDAVAAGGAGFRQATTDSAGNYSISNVPGRFYVYVVPAGTEYLPGGNACRVARTTGGTLNIEVSSSPSTGATYIGSTACIACHADYAGIKYTAHKQGFSVPGQVGGLQDRKNFPNFDDATDLFLAGATHTNGTQLSFGDYDSAKSFDKFKVVVGAGGSLTTKRGEMWLWKNGATYTITLVNTNKPTDPNAVLDLPVDLTYGGTVYKQRFLVQIPNTGAAPYNVARSGRYPLLQFQSYPGISDGDDGYYDRGRWEFRDYHLDWYYTDNGDFKVPAATKTMEANCAACHFVGFNPVDNTTTTGEWLADAVDDVNGAFDVDGDGPKDEINIGCESCHGPGSGHQTANNSRYIVTLGSLTPSRENMVCGTCHDRGEGKKPSGMGGDGLHAADYHLPSPGDSRDHVLSTHMGRFGPALTDYNADEIHSKSHHQQYSDFLKSKHYRNDRQLVVCSDCHDSHAYRSKQGLPEYPHNLRDNPANVNSTLCMRCHALTPITHMDTETGAKHSGEQTRCGDCHMPRTAKTGAGQYGFILSTGEPASSADTYWMGDISSHVFDFVTKSWTGVAGATPGSAMPAPYTNKCGTCHQPGNLQYQNPDSP